MNNSTILRLKEALYIGEEGGHLLKKKEFVIEDSYSLAQDRDGVSFIWDKFSVFIPHSNIVGMYHLTEILDDGEEKSGWR